MLELLDLEDTKLNLSKNENMDGLLFEVTCKIKILLFKGLESFGATFHLVQEIPGNFVNSVGH